MENFAPANYLGEFIDMPTTDNEAGLVRYVKHIHPTRFFILILGPNPPTNNIL